MFSKMSIRDKLVFALAGTALIAFAFASTALVIYENITLENRAQQMLEPYAQLVSVAAEAAVAFEEPERAQEILDTLRANKQILEADIVLGNGSVLAGYNSSSKELVLPHVIKSEGLYLHNGHVELVESLKNEARLHLVMNLEQLNRDTENILWLFAAGAFFLVVVMYGLLAVLQRTIVRPIATLDKTTEQIRLQADYHQRAPASGNDEVARLGRSFNAMMTAIEERESELNRLNAELEERVRQRTEELTQARDAAETANKIKSTFLSNMSHELRTPLNAILGYTQILGQKKEEDRQLQIGLQTIHQAGEHLLSLINNILDLSKIEAGKVELEMTVVNIHLFLSQVANLIRVKAEEKGVLFESDFSKSLPLAILADEGRLRQVLLNLLGNAIKFTEQGSVKLSVSSINNNGSVTLRFEVLDTGIGILPEKLNTIFEPFEQVGARRQNVGGTGLGLAISSQLIQQMGGEIKVESTAGQGSRFWFEVSFNQALDMEMLEEDQDWNLPLGYEGPVKKVLIVDDVQTNRDVLVSLLLPLGFEILEADNGQEGVTAAINSIPDIIFMDMVMPVMDGIDACRELRKIDTTHHIPIIALSADSSKVSKTQALQAGADEFLSKPFDINNLITLIGQLMSLQWQYGENEEYAESMIISSIKHIQLPSLDELESLLNIVNTGNMRDIKEQASLLLNQDEGYRPFATKLLKLADEFHSVAIVELVQAAIYQVKENKSNNVESDETYVEKK